MAFAPSAGFAQGFSFDEEEAAEAAEEAAEVDTQDPAGLEFSVDETTTTKYSDESHQQVAIVAVPSEQMDSDRRAQVQAEMERVASKITTITALSGSAVLGALEASGGEACVQEPLCLADVGEQAGVDRILVARVSASANGTELKLDYFDVEDKLFVRFKNTDGLGNTGSIVRAVEPAMNDIFDVRDLSAGQTYQGDEDSSTVQTVIAFGTAGLAVASLVGGIVMGLGAKKAADEVINSPKTGDVYNYTQVEARDAIRPAQSKATTANVFYGLAVGLAAVSAVFFVIRSGSDVDKSEQASKRGIKDLQIAPSVSGDGPGIGATFRF